MRKTVIAAASALALLAMPALGQMTSPGGAPRGGGSPGATQPAPKQPMPDPMKQEDVSQIQGAAVYGSDDKKIGSISTVLMKPESKQIDRLVVGAGGVLGIGAHEVALPVDQFHWDADKGGFKLAKTEDELKSMPAWKAPGTSTSASGSSTPASSPTTSR